jgi:hypothetical protein
MYIAYVIVTALVAGANAYAAASDLARPEWLLANFDRLSVPRTWLPTLAALKAAGAFGLLVGIAAPAIGVAAAAGLVLYFSGAIVTVVRARWYSHAYAVPYLLGAAASLALRLATW